METLSAHHLKLLRKELSHYVDPNNRKGFFRNFVWWVVRHWGSGEKYISKHNDPIKY